MRLRFAFSKKFVLVFAVIFLAQDGLADVVYSDLSSPINKAGTDVSGTLASAELGGPASEQDGKQIFQAGGSFALSGVTVGVYYPPAEPGFTSVGGPSAVFGPFFNVSLYSNYQYTYAIHNIIYTQNQPGTLIEEVGQGLVAPNGLGLVTANSPLGTTMLAAGSLYWIVLTPANPDTLVVWGSVNTGESLEVDGRQITPEPSTFAFVTLAGGVALALAWKRRTAVASDLL